MAYSEQLAERIRKVLADRDDITEKKMFGGMSFLLNGKMCVGVIKDKMVVRVGKEQGEVLCKKPHAKTMNFTGKPMKAFVEVKPEGIKAAAQLKKWIAPAIAFVQTLEK